MADSRFEGDREEEFRGLPTIQEGEPVLTFRGPKMRRGECVLVDSEDRKVRYLIRYQRAGLGAMGEERVAFEEASQQHVEEGAQEMEIESEGEAGPGLEGGPESEGGEGAKEREEEPAPEAEEEGDVEPMIEAAPSILEAGASRSPSPKRRRRSSPSPSQRRSPSRSRSSTSSTLTGYGGAAGPVTSRQSGTPRFQLSREQLCSIVVIGGWEYEWVPENRLLRYSAVQVQLDSDAALQMAAKREQQEDCPVTSTGGSTSRPATVTGPPAFGPPPSKRGRRGRGWGRGRLRSLRRRSQGGRGAGGDSRRVVHVNLPKALKPLLVQDWELVIFGKKLFTLPARKTVDAILTEYASFQESLATPARKNAVNELMAMIKEYFDMVLGTQLLYNFERPQYTEILVSQPTAQMSQIYGGAHLLRLFPQMASLLSLSLLGENSLGVLLTHLQDFLEYLASNPSLLFIDPTDYQVATEEYQQLAG
ncbi:mortality factor 4-like protein 1 [Gracilinanus agilis]|uniref:mortality factor 4-like protein 1 n=1 Tax=Gracilinanus agilis TaxID=191870 RepID=UPI001CFDB772|nr:mortality factor 4-like protein 1 [Gracilinanus agilis]